jgi:hypothetical protein
LGEVTKPALLAPGESIELRGGRVLDLAVAIEGVLPEGVDVLNQDVDGVVAPLARPGVAGVDRRLELPDPGLRPGEKASRHGHGSGRLGDGWGGQSHVVLLQD